MKLATEEQNWRPSIPTPVSKKIEIFGPRHSKKMIISTLTCHNFLNFLSHVPKTIDFGYFAQELVEL
jgi:hypothetical protein